MLEMEDAEVMRKVLNEQWYIFLPEKHKLKKVEFDELPENPGHVFMVSEMCSMGSYEEPFNDIRIYSPYGDLEDSFNLLMGKNIERRQRMAYNKRISEIVKSIGSLINEKNLKS